MEYSYSSRTLKLIDGMAWADQRIIDALSHCSAAIDEAIPLLSHLLAAERVWLDRLMEQRQSIEVWPKLSLLECNDLAARNAVDYKQFVAGLSNDDAVKIIAYQTSRGEAMASQVEDVLSHVFLHGYYHRGQIAKIIGKHGGQVPPTDFILFCREKS